MNVASSPRATAKYFLLMEELTFRHLYGIDKIVPGSHRVRAASGFFDRDDDWASSATPGLSGMVVAAFEPLEAQGRGFQHGHRKVRGRPAGIVQLWKSLMQSMLSAEHREDEPRSSVKSHNENLLQAVSAVQYESALLQASCEAIRHKSLSGALLPSTTTANPI